MSIKLKLYGGFGILVLIAIALALYAILEFNGIGSNVVKMNALADNTGRVLQIENYLEKMRRSALRYAYDHDEAAAKENGEIANKAIATLRDAEKATLSEERRKLYNGLQTDIAAVQKVTESLFDAVKQMQAEQAKLYGVGNDLTDTTNVIVGKVKAGSDEDVVRLVDKLYAQLLTVRVVNWRTQATLDPKGLAILASEVGKASDTIAALEAAGGAQTLRARVGQLKIVLADYAATADAYIKHQQQVGDFYAHKIAPQIKQMQALTEKARSQLQDAFAEARTSTESSIANTVAMQEIIAALTLVFGGLIAFFMARSVPNPITALTKAMRELAAGNFAVVLPGLSRKDEVGNIAKAVDEFKVKAAEKAQREATEKAEADQRAEAERQAALAKMADEFQASVGDIVQAAVAGDFSRRVDLEGKAGLVLNVGTLINGLCDNVANALRDLVQMLSALAEGQSIRADHLGIPRRFRRAEEQRQYRGRAHRADDRRNQARGPRSDQCFGGNLGQYYRSVAAHGGAGR
jgi:HAMP domain-containing protein